MSQESEFDPYHKWLGISPQYRPPDHYRLLGLELLESDTDVIRSASERQATYLQTYKIGKHSDLSQRLLTEVARARVCLLDAAKKAEYDQKLIAAPHFAVSPREPIAPPVDTNAPPAGAAPPRESTGSDPQGSESPAANSSPFQVISNDRVATVRRIDPRKRRQRSTWLPALAICIPCLVLSAVAILKLQSSSGAASSTPLVPSVIGPDGGGPTPQSPLDQDEHKLPLPTPPRSPGKKLVPNAEAERMAHFQVRSQRDLPAKRLFESGQSAADPARSYVLYKMALEAAVKSHQSSLANEITNRLVADFEVNNEQVHAILQEANQSSNVANVPAPRAEALPTPDRPQPPADTPPAYQPSEPTSQQVAPPEFVLVPPDHKVDLELPRPLLESSVVERFPPPSEGTGLFVLPGKSRPEGIFTFTMNPEPMLQGPMLHGQAIVLHANNRPAYFLKYENGELHGPQYSWNESGELELRSVYFKGNRRGLTSIYERGQLVAVENWKGPANCKRYRIEILGGEAVARNETGKSKDLFRSRQKIWIQVFDSWVRERASEQFAYKKAISEATRSSDRTRAENGLRAWEGRLTHYYEEGRNAILKMVKTSP